MELPKLKKEKICNTTFKVAGCFFVLSILLSAFVTNKYAIKGAEMNLLIEQKQKLENEISQLQLEISQASSLKSIEGKASKLGFVKYNHPLEVISTSKFAHKVN